jgi:hypothetical protein
MCMWLSGDSPAQQGADKAGKPARPRYYCDTDQDLCATPRTANPMDRNLHDRENCLIGVLARWVGSGLGLPPLLHSARHSLHSVLLFCQPPPRETMSEGSLEFIDPTVFLNILRRMMDGVPWLLCGDAL